MSNDLGVDMSDDTSLDMSYGTGTSIKVMTFNLRVNVAFDGNNAWAARVSAAARAIAAHGADLVCVQEGQHAMLLDLEPYLSDYVWIGEGRRGGLEDEFCAIFYKKDRLTAVESGHFGLSETPERLGALGWGADYPRMCTWVRFETANGETFAAFNTHLDHVSEEAQIKGMALIEARIASLRGERGAPVVLTGDFNVEPSHPVVRALEKAGYRSGYSAAASAPGRTFHGFEGGALGEPIDYIFATPDLRFDRIEVDRRLYENRYPSDHYPVVATLSLLTADHG